MGLAMFTPSYSEQAIDNSIKEPSLVCITSSPQAIDDVQCMS